MSNSVVKVTETPTNDSLILVIGEDGTVSPDKETVEAYLNSRSGETELQIMHVNKSDGKSMDVTVDTLTYLASHNEEVSGTYSKVQDMDEISRNLNSFRMDHDYTPLTSPRRPSPVEEVTEIDELAHTLSLLEGSNSEQLVTRVVPQLVTRVAPVKVVKAGIKTIPKRIVPLNTQPTKNKIKPTQSTTIFKQPVKTPVKAKPVKQKPVEEDEQEEEEESYSDEDFTMESEESEDDANDSDFEIDETSRHKSPRKISRTRPRVQPEPAVDSQRPVKVSKIVKTFPPKLNIAAKTEPEPKIEKPPEVSAESKVIDKKSVPKKEKKIPKPIPDDFALFSTPDIIRRVGGKQDSVTTPTTPTTPSTPESPKSLKPARIFSESPKPLSQRGSLEFKEKRLSTDGKPVVTEKESTLKQPVHQHRLSLGSENKNKERRHSIDVKMRRQSVDIKTDFRINADKVDIKKIQASASDANSSKGVNHVTVQSLEESSGGNSNESITENHLEPMPSAEDIRAIIQNEDTKTFTTSLVIPEPDQSVEPNVDPSHINLETAALDLDQSILDNINSDLISEDILYQVAQSLVDNAELQNAIDKSLVDGNLVLDPIHHHTVPHDHGTPIQQSQSTLNDQDPTELSTPTTIKGTQIVRSGGRVVVIPPIERPTTRSRNKKQQEMETPKQIKLPSRLLDDEHVSGAELDSSSDDDKSDDDPDKLWCICNQPHNNRFMICCDTCEEWYHGKCVNVTKAMGQMMEQEGKEWICLYCKDSSLKRPAAAARRVRKASRTSSTENVVIDRKSDVSVTSSLGSPTSVPGCLVCGKPCRTNSIYCSDPCILKHAKVVEKVVVFERSSGRILSGNNAPSAANLDKWLQQNPGFEVVRSTSANKPVTTTAKPLTQSKLKIVKNAPAQGGVSLAVQRKGVNVSILRHSPKPQQQVPSQQKTISKQNITGFKIISKQVVATPRTKLIQPAPLVRSPGVIASSKPKVVQTSTPVKATPPPPPPVPTPPKDKPMPQKTPKSRQAEETAPQPKKEENIRDNVQKTLFEQLTNRLKLINDIKLMKEEVTKISTDIELQLYKCFGDTGQKYRNKYRSLIFNIKDIKNQTLWRRICEKSISPYQLVRLSPDDMASQELALWRERENKHQLDMITKSELEQLGRNRQYVFKTHKGEQELEENRPTDAVDNTEVVMALGADSSASPESSSDAKKDSKEKKGSKHSRSERDRNHDRKSSKEKDKDGRKDRKRDHRSSSRDRSRRKKSRSKEKEANRHTEKNRSRSRDRDRHRRSSHKSSRHKKDIHSTTEKLDKKSKEILEQLVDSKIVPPLEDRLWKHVQQEDITTAPMAESDSDHEPTSTVTIPTPPRTGDMEELQTTPVSPNDISEIKDEKQDEEKNSNDDALQVGESCMDDDGSRSPPPRTQADFIWKGTINMVDVAQISITAHEVSGDCSGLGEELPPCLDVVGRISPDTVWDYIGKMKCSNSKAISLLRLNATNMEEKMPYIALYSYLSSRNRLGVVKSNNKAVKDFYILPLASQKPIPQSLLPLNGPGFEESRPALLLGIIVRDKRKRPLFGGTPVANKRSKLDISSLPSTPIAAPAVTPSRSYTPPPNSDPRLKHASVSSKVSLKDSPKEEPVEDMDEPYSPEDSDPDTAPITPADSSKSSTHLNAADLSNLLTGSVKASSFLETGLTTQTFEPFSNKFDTIPGLDESGAIIPSNSEELKRKMEELDQRIAMQKAEIDNMSQNIASTSSSNLGTSALASIALPSNLQQILDSIKGINATTGSEAEALQMIKQESKPSATTDSDLTIPLILPKISARSHSTSATSASSSSSPTIPLNLPKYKSKLSTGSSPTQLQNTVTKTVSQRQGESDKSASVLSSLSEEDLIRKAAEMLGETEDPVKSEPKEFNSPTTSYKPTTFSSGPILYTAPTNLLPPSPLMGTTPISVVTSKSAKLDVSQPPIPGLED